MKKLYWRPRGVSRTVLLLLSALSIAGLVTVEQCTTHRMQPHNRKKMAAARLAKKAIQIVKTERLRRDIKIDPVSDPAQSGLVGLPMSSVTSAAGSLESKQTAINPNLAAAVVAMLEQAGLEKGDLVAIGVSGSFPGANIAAYAACQTLGLEAIIVASAAASQWGANQAQLTWLDMEKILADAGVFQFRSIAATLGGIEDRGLGMSDEGRRALAEAIRRNDVRQLQHRDFTEGVDQRMEVFREKAGANPIGAYINVGGGAVSVGRRVGKVTFRSGLNVRVPSRTFPIDSVMSRFLRDGTPVIHMSGMKRLAKRYGLPIAPQTLPNPGEGGVFFREEYNLWLTAGFLLAIILGLFAFIRSDLGYRIFQGSGRKSGQQTPEAMV